MLRLIVSLVLCVPIDIDSQITFDCRIIYPTSYVCFLCVSFMCFSCVRRV